MSARHLSDATIEEVMQRALANLTNREGDRFDLDDLTSEAAMDAASRLPEIPSEGEDDD